MKTIKFVLTLIIAFLAVNLQAQADKKVSLENTPVISFERMVHDFGTLNEGDVVETTFKFTNTGNAPLTITRIKSTCGCTVPQNWKKTPILAGEKSQFSVKFNTKNKPNKQSKRITITSNAKGNNSVTIKANVIPDPAMQQAREERMKKYREKRAADKLKNVNNNKLKQTPIKKSDKKNSINSSTKPQAKELKKPINKKRVSDKTAVLKKNDKKPNGLKQSVKKNDDKIIKVDSDKKKSEGKEVKKKADKIKKLEDKILAKKSEIAKDESKLLKLQTKLDRKTKKGELAPNDIAKKERIIKKKQQKINKLNRKLKKLESKL